MLDRFSQTFHHMKALYVQMMDLYLVCQFVKGRCHGNQIMWRKCYILTPIGTTCIRCTSARKRNDNIKIELYPLTTEMMGLHCLKIW